MTPQPPYDSTSPNDHSHQQPEAIPFGNGPQSSDTDVIAQPQPIAGAGSANQPNYKQSWLVLAGILALSLIIVGVFLFGRSSNNSSSQEPANETNSSFAQEPVETPDSTADSDDVGSATVEDDVLLPFSVPSGWEIVDETLGSVDFETLGSTASGNSGVLFLIHKDSKYSSDLGDMTLFDTGIADLSEEWHTPPSDHGLPLRLADIDGITSAEPVLLYGIDPDPIVTYTWFFDGYRISLIAMASDSFIDELDTDDRTTIALAVLDDISDDATASGPIRDLLVSFQLSAVGD